MNRTLIFICGFALVICGMTLVLRNWDDIETVFRGVMPMALAVLGLVIMFAASIKK